MIQGENTKKINSLFGFNQQNAGQKWLWFIFASLPQACFLPVIVDLQGYLRLKVW